MSIFHQNPKRPGAGKTGSEATGKGPRVGNRPHTDADIDAPGGRHTTGHGQVEFTSENWPTREGGAQAKETTPGGTGQFEFNGTPESGSYIQRERVPRQEVKDAEIKGVVSHGNEKEQRKTGKAPYDPATKMNNPRNAR